MKRKIEIVVLSDLHLGSKTCKAKELLNYLKSIKPQILILNGDIINTSFVKALPMEHFKVINRLMKMLTQGTRVYYITGKSDASVRRFSDFSNGNLYLCDHLVLLLGGKKYWFFHGDALDTPFLNTGGIKSFFFRHLSFFKILNPFKAHFNDEKFEERVLKLADIEGYDAVVCGHSHLPKIEKKDNILYLNSGDWVENCTALEYNFSEWSIYKYDALDFDTINPKLKVKDLELDEDEIKMLQSEKESKKAVLKKPKDYVIIKSRNSDDWVHNEQLWDGIEV